MTRPNIHCPTSTFVDPKQLVENRISFAGPHSELSIYDTYLPALDVQLQSDQLLYCGMVSGKKIMHGQKDGETFEQEFLPHESFVMAPGSEVEIDFPEARLEHPTRCLTIEISNDQVQRLIQPYLDNEHFKASNHHWHETAQHMFHTDHGEGTQALVNRLFNVFTQNDTERDLAIEFGIAELITRLARQKGYQAFLDDIKSNPEQSGIHAVVHYLRSNLDQPLDIGHLSKLGCMSRSKLFNAFKEILGCTPAELLHKLRLDQAVIELRKGKSVTQVGFELGYSNPSHFCKRFQQQFGKAPSQYLKSASN